MNPWLIAAGVFALMGALDEMQKAEKGKKPALPKSEKPAASASPVTVNVQPNSVQSESKPGKKAKVPKQPTDKVLPNPSGDG